MTRYYCPGCGQVAGPDLVAHVAEVDGEHVLPHLLTSRLSRMLGEGRRSLEICPGGEIDRAKDRAP